MDEPETERQITPEMVRAIAALGSKPRLEILRALAVADNVDGAGGLTFSELHESVDVESSSQFSYHLDKVVDRFVSEYSGGYRLTPSGRTLVRAILSGVYERPDHFVRQPVDGVCVFCESHSLVATRDHGEFVVRCTTCADRLVTTYFPRSQAVGRTDEAVIESVGQRIWSGAVNLRGGVCPECYGRVETELDSHQREETTRYTHRCSCQVCQVTLHLPVEVAVTIHPATIGLFWSRGISLFSHPLWELFEHFVSDEFETTGVREDPLELSCTVTLGEESLTFLIDESLQPSLSSAY